MHWHRQGRSRHGNLEVVVVGANQPVVICPFIKKLKLACITGLYIPVGTSPALKSALAEKTMYMGTLGYIKADGWLWCETLARHSNAVTHTHAHILTQYHKVSSSRSYCPPVLNSVGYCERNRCCIHVLLDVLV